VNGVRWLLVRLRRFPGLTSWAALCFPLMLVSAACGMGDERVRRADDFIVTINSRWVGSGRGGYYPIRVRIENRGPERSIEMRFTGRGDALPHVRRRVTVAQNGTVISTLLVPCVGSGTYGQFDVLSQGRVIEGLTETINLPDTQYDGLASPALLVISPTTVNCDLFEIAVELSAETLSPYSGYYSSSRGNYEVIPPELLPRSWIDYSGVDLVALSLAELDAMESEERDAVLKWVHTGGTLLVYDVGQESEETLGELLDLDGTAAVGDWQQADPGLRVKLGETQTLSGSGESPAQATRGFVWPEDAFASRSVMLGKVYAFADNPFPGSPSDWAWLIRSIGRERLDWSTRHGMSARMSNSEFLEFLIPSVKGVPVGAFLVLITVFTILIGPLNYIYMLRRKRLYQLIVSIPLTAFLTTAALFAYSAIAHGFSTRSRVRSLTVLDQQSNTAVSMSRMALYSGLAPSGGLRFSPETAVYPIWPPYGGFDTGEVDWTESQQLAAGWLRSRTRTQFLTVSHWDYRGRVELQSSDQKATLSNGLEWDLEAIVIRDDAGRTFYGTNIPAGASAEVVPITLDERRDFARLLDQHRPELPADFADRGGGLFSGVSFDDYSENSGAMNFEEGMMERSLQALKGVQSPNHAMANRSYIAVVADLPDIETGLETTRAEATQHVLVGHF